MDREHRHQTARTHERRALGYLRDLLEDHDLRQGEVERRVGWTQGYLSQLLGGHVDLRIHHLETLLGALDTTPGEFFGHLFESPPPPGNGARQPREVNAETAQVCSFGIEAVRELSRRVLSCERALEKLAYALPES